MDEHDDDSLTRAHWLYEAGQVSHSLDLCGQRLAVDPQDPDALALAALCHMHREDWAQAIKAAAHAVQSSPDWAQAHYVQALVHARRGASKAAMEAAHEVLRLDPEDSRPHALLADLYSDRAEWGKALAACEDALRLDPESSYARQVRGQVLLRSGEHDKAREAAEELLERDPEDDEGHALLGWTTLAAGDERAAEMRFLEALRLDAENQDARDGLLESLKARRGIYRPLLAWSRWMKGFTSGEQAVVIVVLATVAMSWPLLIMGALADYPLLLVIAEWARENVPMLSTAGGVIDVVLKNVYLVFMLLTWTGDPLLHLFLMREQRLRLTLTREEMISALIFGAVMLLAIGGGIANGAVLGTSMGFATFLALAAQVVPAPNVVGLREGVPRVLGALIAVALLTVAIYGTLRPHVTTLDVGLSASRALVVATWGGIMASWAWLALDLIPQRSKTS